MIDNNTAFEFMDELQDKITHLVKYLNNKYPKINFGECTIEGEDKREVFMDWNGKEAFYRAYFSVDKHGNIYTDSIFRTFYDEDYNPRQDDDHVIPTHPNYTQVIKDVEQCLSDVVKMKATNALNTFVWN